VNVAVLEVLKPVDALIGFFEGDVQFRLELAARAALSRGSVVGSNGVGRLAKLHDGFLGFFRLRRLTAEGKDREREQARPLEQVAWWHAGEAVQGKYRAVLLSKTVASLQLVVLIALLINFDL